MAKYTLDFKSNIVKSVLSDAMQRDSSIADALSIFIVNRDYFLFDRCVLQYCIKGKTPLGVAGEIFAVGELFDEPMGLADNIP